MSAINDLIDNSTTSPLSTMTTQENMQLSQDGVRDEDVTMEGTEGGLSMSAVDKEKLGASLRQAMDEASDRVMLLLKDKTRGLELESARHNFQQAKSDLKDFQDIMEHYGSATKAQAKLGLVVPKDLPRFQIKGATVVYDDTKKMHDSVHAFIGVFEAQMKAYGLVPYDHHWERLFLLACHETQHQWFITELAERNLSWSTVRSRLEKEFGSPFYLWRKKDEYKQLSQRPDESVRMFLNRFLGVSYEAQMPQDQALVHHFVCSLQPKIKRQAWQILTNQYGLTLPTELNSTAQLIMASCGEDTSAVSDTPSSTFSENGKRRYDSSEQVGSKKQRHGFNRKANCPVHPKGSHLRDECTVWQDAVKEASHLRRSAGGSRHSPPCRYCKKPFTDGHRCDEYRQAKTKQYTANRAARVVVGDPDVVGHLPVDMGKLAIQEKE